MASRKLPPTSGELFGGVVLEGDQGPLRVIVDPTHSPLLTGVDGILVSEADTPIVAERTLRIVPPIVEDEVSVEPCGEGRYLVSLVKHGGGTRAHVYYSRAQLEMLMRRIPPALEVGS